MADHEQALAQFEGQMPGRPHLLAQHCLGPDPLVGVGQPLGTQDDDGVGGSGRFARVTRVRTKVFAPEARISGKWGSNRGECRPR